MRIDSHHHLWTLSRGDYSWLTPELGSIHRNFVPADLEPHIRAAGIGKTVVVQAADSVAETEFLLDVADKTGWIGGVVGWIDMEASDAVPTLLRLSANPKFRGIRPMIQGIEDEAWVLRDALDPVFDALVEHGLTFDALVLPRHLRPLLARLKNHPGLRCVINHGAKPALTGGDIEEWKADIALVARETDCRCKLSGLLTETGDQPTLENIRPAAEHLMACFGPERLMFGSDWPVLNLASDYCAWVDMVELLLSKRSHGEKNMVWAGTAIEFYGL